jgi:hypothetical protein
MKYIHLGSGDYLVTVDPSKIEKVIEVMAEKSYQTATLKRDFMSQDGLILEDFITYSSDREKITGLNMGLINQRQCYTRLQKMFGTEEFIFRGQYFEKSGRDPETFLESVVKEIENNK